MGSSKGLLNFGLMLSGLWIILTLGFTSGQHCASLHSAVNYGGGEAFDVIDGSSFSDLQDEFVTLNDVWSGTLSFQVEPGCILTACKESYFNGECRDFTEGQSTLPSPFENILSASCVCPRTCKCENVKNIRKNGCARAYVSAGGCNSCTPYYKDIRQGQSDTFPEDYETRVSSLIVRPGCQLIVYDEPELEGEPHSVENITERWTQPVRSYNCSCDPNYKAPSRQPEVPLNNYPSLISIPESMNEIAAMAIGGLGRHPGLLAAIQSNRRKRSPKNAYILLLGSAGTGKSSTINFLFDNLNLTRVRQHSSTAAEIHEFRIPVPVDELGIRNSELRVIDTPGLGSTDGLEADARFLAALEEFLDGHEELKDRIPNVVMIFHKFSDNRFEGEGSQFVRMLRALESFRERLTDKRYSNVIFVLSHFTSETKSVARNPKKKLSAFKKVIEEFTRFPRPIVLAVAENKAEDQDLLMLNGNYKLANGDFYPKNLFDRITQVTQGGEDVIGDAVIRSAFRNPDDINISFHFSLRGHLSRKTTKYFGELLNLIVASERTEVSERLSQAHDTMTLELRRRFPGALRYLQQSLNRENYRKTGDLPRTTTGIAKLLSEIRQNEAVLYLLTEAFDISPPAVTENIESVHTIKMLNIFLESAMNESRRCEERLSSLLTSRRE